MSVAQSARGEKRHSKDRRRRPTPFLSTYSLTRKGRRLGPRRMNDRVTYGYADRYDPASVLTLITALLLSIADAFFTLQLVSRGAREVNPVMDFFLQLGPMPFLLAKYLITGSSLVFFLAHKHRPFFGGLTGRHLLMAVPFIYTLVILWELALNWRLS